MTNSTKRTTIHSLLILAVAALVAGCGGASDPSAPAVPLAEARLSGQVFEIDGVTTHLGGVVLLLAETQQTAVTSADGLFDFGSVPVGTLSLELMEIPEPELVASLSASDAGGGASSSSSGNDDSGNTDANGPHRGEEIEDGENCEGNGLHVHRAENQERIRVRLKVCNGEICQMQMSRSGHGELEVEVVMTPTEVNQDEDMTGKVELESRDDRERFKVYVRKADPGLVLDAVVVAPAGDEESIGTREVCLEGGATWILDTSEGDELPFDALGVGDLEGYVVEVRDFDTDVALLTATLPELPEAVDDDPQGSGDGEATRTRSRIRMESHEGEAEGAVEIRSRTRESEECLEIKAHRMQEGREVVFEVETTQGSGQFAIVSQATADQAGEAKLQVNTRYGDTLPNDAEGVRELVRLRVRIRDANTGAVVASGTIASLVPDA